MVVRPGVGRLWQRQLNEELTDHETRITSLEGGGGGSYTPVTFSAQGTATANATTEQTLTWETPFITDAAFSASGGNTLVCNTAGTYLFFATVQVGCTNRCELSINTYLDTGSGFTVQSQYVARAYVTRDASQDQGGVVAVGLIALSAGDELQWRAFGETDGGAAATLQPNGTRIGIWG